MYECTYYFYSFVDRMLAKSRTGKFSYDQLYCEREDYASGTEITSEMAVTSLLVGFAFGSRSLFGKFCV